MCPGNTGILNKRNASSYSKHPTNTLLTENKGNRKKNKRLWTRKHGSTMWCYCMEHSSIRPPQPALNMSLRRIPLQFNARWNTISFKYLMEGTVYAPGTKYVWVRLLGSRLDASHLKP